jgi:hypothetical protein
MTAAITTLRSTIATILTDDTKYQTYSFPPATLTANSVVLSWDDPAIEPTNNKFASISPKANFKILITVPLFDNQGNLQGIEDLLIAVYNKLAASNLDFTIGSVSTPAVMNVPSGDLLTCDLAVSILTSWS